MKMRKGIKVVLIILGVIIMLGLIFFAVDYNRAKNGEKPIFCINTAIANDGGTKEYLGLGYKVIDFKRLDGYDEVKIGTWSMKYEDFENEYSNYTKELSNTKVVVNGYNNIPSITITNDDAIKIKKIINSFEYDNELCDGIYSYEIIINDEEHYMIKQDCKAIEKGDKQADITQEELKSIEKIIENNIDKQKPLEKIPQYYPMNQAIKDGCVVMSNNAVFNKSMLDSFIDNTNVNNKDRKSDFIRFVQYTIEGDAIITDLEYKADVGYILTTDNTRDAFGADTRVIKNSDIPSRFYTIDLVENKDLIDIALLLTGEIDYDSNKKEYKPITVASYSKDSEIYGTAPSFIGEVTEINDKTIIVKTEEKNLGDAVSVKVENSKEYSIRDKVKVFYTGFILETYPCQIYEIEVNKIDEQIYTNVIIETK